MTEHCENGILNCKEQEQTPLHSSSSLICRSPLISYLLSKGTLLDTQGYTPLQVAVRFGNVASVEQVFASDASPLIEDDCGCNCLHVAVMFKRKEVFKCLLKHPEITKMSNATNNDGDLPIHLALRKGLSNFVIPLLKTTHEITDKNGNNYFHLAALAGDQKTIENVLTYPFVESMINATNSSGKTPLHCSAIGGNLGCISLLLDHGAIVNKCESGRTPFMYACSDGKLQCTKLLFEAHPFQRDWKDDQGNTALHLAAKSGSLTMTNYCLDVGAVVSLNNEQNSFFDIIIDAINSKLAISVLRHQRWQECLDTTCPTKPHPVMRLNNLIPSAFPVILDQSVQRSSLDPQHKDYWVKYNFKYISLPTGPSDTNGTDANVDSDKDDREEGAVRFSQLAQQSKPQIESSSAQPDVQVEIEVLPRNEESTENLLGVEIQHGIQHLANCDSSGPIEKEEKASTLLAQDVHADHDPDNSEKKKQDGGVPSIKVLKYLAKHRHKKCLTHPLVVKYLDLKWKAYARMPYIAKCWLTYLWTILLSTFIAISPVPSGQLEQTTVSNESTNNLPEEEMISTAANVIRFMTIFLTGINVINWVAFIYVLRLKLITHFIREFEFWLYSCAIISTFIYLIPFGGLNSVIYEAGAIAIFSSWVVALLQLQMFGYVGIYISMLINTTKNVLKVLAICSFLFCAFAFAFHILVGSIPELQFTNVGTSLVSSLSAALAIIDLNTFVALESSLRFRVFVFVFYVLLLIILPIVLINLLIGMAVGDIAKIQEDAKVNRQIYIVTNLANIDERYLSRKLLCRLHRESYMHYPNRFGESWLERNWKKLVNTCTSQEISIEQQEVAYLETREEEDTSMNLEELKCQVNQLVQTQTKQTDTLARVEVMLQQLMESQGLKHDD